MEPEAAAYLAAAASQLGGISAFLGGFSATMLATLLIARRGSRASGLAIGFSAASAAGFIVGVVAATNLSSGVHPGAPEEYFNVRYLQSVQTIMNLAFMIGISGLLVALGASGWVRSRGMGWITTGLSAAAFVAVAFLTVRTGS